MNEKETWSAIDQVYRREVNLNVVIDIQNENGWSDLSGH